MNLASNKSLISDTFPRRKDTLYNITSRYSHVIYEINWCRLNYMSPPISSDHILTAVATL